MVDLFVFQGVPNELNLNRERLINIFWRAQEHRQFIPQDVILTTYNQNLILVKNIMHKNIVFPR